MTSITTRAGKGSPLTHNEVDANFTNLNNDKLDTAGIALGSAASPTLKFTGDPNTGIYSPGANQVAVATNGGERARIDSGGRLLVGTSTSRQSRLGTSVYQTQFQLESSANQAGLAVSRFNDATNGSFFNLQKGRGTIASPAAVIANDVTGNIVFSGWDGAAFTNSALIRSEVDGTPGTDDMPGRLVFSTTADGAAIPTERMRITSAGVLQVADAGDITVGTTTGTKIGTATTQKIGFYNATPVVQPTAVADATDAATVITQLNALLTRMRNLGLIAT